MMQRSVSTPYLVAPLRSWSTAGLCSGSGGVSQPLVSRGHGGLDPTAGDYGRLHGLRQKRLRQPWAHAPVLESDDGGHGHVGFHPGLREVVWSTGSPSPARTLSM